MRRGSPAREPGDGAEEGPQSAKALARLAAFPRQAAAGRRQHGLGDVDPQALGSPWYSRELDIGSPLPPLNIPPLNSPPLFHPSPRRNMAQQQNRVHTTAVMQAPCMDAFEPLLSSQSPAYSKMMFFSPNALGSNNIFDTPTHRGMLQLPPDLATPTPRRGAMYDQMGPIFPGGAGVMQATWQQQQQHHHHNLQHHPQQQHQQQLSEQQQRVSDAAGKPPIGSGGSAAGQARASHVGSEQPAAVVPVSSTPRDAMLQALAGGTLSPDFGLGHTLGILQGFGALDPSTLHVDATALDVQNLTMKDMLLGGDDDTLTPSHLAISLGLGGPGSQRNRILPFNFTPRAANTAAGGLGTLGRPGAAGLPLLPPPPLLPSLPGAGGPTLGAGRMEVDQGRAVSPPGGPVPAKLQPGGLGGDQLPSANEDTAAREVVVKTEAGVFRTRNATPDGRDPAHAHSRPHATTGSAANGDVAAGAAAPLGLVPSLQDMMLMNGLPPMPGVDPSCSEGGLVNFGEALAAQRGVPGRARLCPVEEFGIRHPGGPPGGNASFQPFAGAQALGLQGTQAGLPGFEVPPPPRGDEHRHTPDGGDGASGGADRGGGGGGGGFGTIDPGPQGSRAPVALRQAGGGAGGGGAERPGLPPRGAGLGPVAVFGLNASGAASTPSTQQRPQRSRTANQLYGGGSAAAAASEGLRRGSMDLDAAPGDQAMSADGPGAGRRLSATGSAATGNRGRRPSDSANAKSCKCKKSQCLKLYCDCFAAGQYCGACSCSNCHNRPEYADRVQQRREDIAARDPQAFTRKIQHAPNGNGKHKRGCNCRRSHCLKKYCECYQGGVKCGIQCTCLECENMDVGAPAAGGRATGKRGAAARKAAAARANSYPSSSGAGGLDDGALSPPLPSTSGCSEGPSPAESMGTVQGLALAMQLPLAQQQQQQQQNAYAALGMGCSLLAGLQANHALNAGGGVASRPFSLHPLMQMQMQVQHPAGIAGELAQLESGAGLARSSSFPACGAAGPQTAGAAVLQQHLQGAHSEPLRLLPSQPPQQPPQQQPYGQLPPPTSPSPEPGQVEQAAAAQIQSVEREAPAPTSADSGAEAAMPENRPPGSGAEGPAGILDDAAKAQLQQQDACMAEGQLGSAERGRTSVSTAGDLVMHSANASNDCPSGPGPQPHAETTTATTTGSEPAAAGAAGPATDTLDASAAAATDSSGPPAHAPPPTSAPDSGAKSAIEARVPQPQPAALPPPPHRPGDLEQPHHQHPHHQHLLSFLRGTPRGRDLGLDVVSPPALAEILAHPMSLDTDSDSDELGVRNPIRRDVRRRKAGGPAEGCPPAGPLTASQLPLSLLSAPTGVTPHLGGVDPRGTARAGGGSNAGFYDDSPRLDAIGMDFDNEEAIADAMMAAIAGEAAGSHRGSGATRGSGAGGHVRLPPAAHAQAPGGGGGNGTCTGGAVDVGGGGGGAGGVLLCAEMLTETLLQDGSSSDMALFLSPSEPNSIEGLRCAAGGGSGRMGVTAGGCGGPGPGPGSGGGGGFNGTTMLNEAVAKATANAAARRDAGYLGADGFHPPGPAGAGPVGPTGRSSLGAGPSVPSGTDPSPGGGMWVHQPLARSASELPAGWQGGSREMSPYDSGLQSWSGPISGSGGCDRSISPEGRLRGEGGLQGPGPGSGPGCEPLGGPMAALRGAASASARGGATAAAAAACVHTLVPRVRTDLSKRRDVGQEDGRAAMQLQQQQLQHQVGNEPEELHENWAIGGPGGGGGGFNGMGMPASPPKHHRFVPAPGGPGGPATSSHLPLQPLHAMGGGSHGALPSHASFDFPYMYGDAAAQQQQGGPIDASQQMQTRTGGWQSTAAAAAGGARGGGAARAGSNGRSCGARGGGRNAAAEKEALKAAALEKAVAWQYISQRLGSGGVGPRAAQPGDSDALAGGAVPGPLGAAPSGPSYGISTVSGVGIPLPRHGSVGAGLGGLPASQALRPLAPQQQQQPPPQQPQQQQYGVAAGCASGNMAGSGPGSAAGPPLGQQQPPQHPSQQPWSGTSPPGAAAPPGVIGGGYRDGAIGMMGMAAAAGGDGGTSSLGGLPALATPAAGAGVGGGMPLVRMAVMRKLGSGSINLFSPNGHLQRNGGPRGS